MQQPPLLQPPLISGANAATTSSYARFGTENGVYFYFQIKEKKVEISIDLESGNQEFIGNYDASDR